jgi:hypothetical protein
MARNTVISDWQLPAIVATGDKDFRYCQIRSSGTGVRGGSDIDFRQCNFGVSMLFTGEFRNTSFDHARMSNSSYYHARFENCSFSQVSFADSILAFTSFRNCDLSGCSFRRANFDTVSFTNCSLRGAGILGARCEGIRMVNCDLNWFDVTDVAFFESDIEPFVTSERVRSATHLALDWQTICKSQRSPGLRAFLVRSGMPEIMAIYLVDAARTVDANLLFRLMRSTFISYGGPDAPFARLLRDRLQANGVRTFYFETDAVPGERIHLTMRTGVNSYDRVILICSAASLQRPGVRNEIEETFAREARDGGASYLIPVALDDFVFGWTDPVGVAIRDRVVADFRGLSAATIEGRKDDEERFVQGLGRLLSALRAT